MKDYLADRQASFGGPEAAQPVEPGEVTHVVAAAPVRKRPGDLTEQDIRAALGSCQGNKTRAAAELGIALSTLKARMRALGIES